MNTLALSLFLAVVNPFIGTEGMGHTFPGACVPFGGIQLSPDTDTIPHNVNGKYQPEVYKYCAGYQYDDPTIVGFSHTHMSGTGHSDLGDILIMPQTGKRMLNPGTKNNPDSGYRSRFSHNNESATPGYYKVMLEDYGINAELSATEHTGAHKYTYPDTANSNRIIIDLNHGIYNYDGKTLWANIRVENDTLITGYRITNGWARTNYTYFAIAFSKPVINYGYKDFQPVAYNGFWRKFPVNQNFPEMGGKKVVAYFEFDANNKAPLEVKVAVSATGTDGALKNLKAETTGKSFNQIAQEAEKAWQDALGVIEVEGTPEQKEMFYTSLYHTMINPSIYMDVDSCYRGLDGNIHKADGFTNYTIFSLWDTYRAEHPLLTLLKPRQARDMALSMIRHQQQSAHDLLPIWSHMANDNWCMSGYHAASVLSDAICKGLDINADEAIKAMNSTANVDYLDGLGDYKKLGYVPFEHSSTATSTTLEYAYDDWAIYSAALKAGNKETADKYRSRALNYRNVYDRKLGYARPRLADGSFKKEFDILQTSGEGFIEGNSQNFTFHVPHDVEGLIEITGGDKKFISKLDSLFTTHLPEKYYADNEDVTDECIIGGYVHGNEPSHHIPYLYAWTSEPWKTQLHLRDIMNRMYKPEIRGLGGNDDCGQMSAWYVFSAMGFYPVCPGTDEYVLGAPYLPYIKLNLENGNTFEISAPGVSDKKRYVKSVKLNGKIYDRMFIKHSDIMQGGKLEFVMSDKPNKKRGVAADCKPYSLSNEWNVGEIIFDDRAKGTKGSRIYKAIVPNPESYIEENAKVVLNTLYFGPDDSIAPTSRIYYTLEDIPGVSAKDGSGDSVRIFFSSRHVENFFEHGDTARVLRENRGVLLHELTHAYQLEPQGIGTYSTNKTFWSLIEGIADAVRILNGGFEGRTLETEGHYTDGYQPAAAFFVWIVENKDRDFLRKLNRSTLEVIPWSYEAAFRSILNCEIDTLWQEYQASDYFCQ